MLAFKKNVDRRASYKLIIDLTVNATGNIQSKIIFKSFQLTFLTEIHGGSRASA